MPHERPFLRWPGYQTETRLTRGFASPPHDGFAVVRKGLRCGHCVRQAGCHSAIVDDRNRYPAYKITRLHVIRTSVDG